MLTALHVLSVLHLIPVLSGRHPMNPFEYFNKIIYIRISAARGYHMDGECGRIRIGGQSPDSRGVKRAVYYFHAGSRAVILLRGVDAGICLSSE